MLLERFVIAAERIADALADIAANYGGADRPGSPFTDDNAPTSGEPGKRTRGRPRKDTGQDQSEAQAQAKAEAEAKAKAEAEAKAKAEAEAKAKVEAEAKAKVEAEVKTDTPVQATSAVQGEPDYAPLKAVVIELANSGAEGKAAAVNILSKYGVKKASDAPAAKWPAMIADFQAAIDTLNGNSDEFA